ncbi:hypothetical protein THAR02_00821 [Trichoderma harzianum]|uniref:NWD NACHT-NTPase N-terminal domain-containing protein n=1 Tax=Trichoderma harzianum TaxID=5544 RepID=A0A0G0A4A0_TRIHA|nr:hypothetical protein THAR02_00821 [Trichoderma harzianum]
MNANSSTLHATNSTLSNLPVTSHATDELQRPSTATVSSELRPENSDPALSLAASTRHKSSSDCLSNSSERSSLWEKAYNAATPTTKKWIDGFSKPNGILKSAESTQMEELIEIVRDMEKRHQDHAFQDHTLQIRIRGKQIRWKDYAPRVISFIKAIGDIAIQFAPASSGIIWPALKTVLQMSVAPGEELAAILGCSEKVLSIVRRGKVYETIYLNSANTIVPVQEDLERSLVDVYTKSLDLLAHVGQRLAKEYRHVLVAIVNPGAAEGPMDRLIKSETDLIIAAQACEVVRSVDAERHLSTMLDTLSESLMQINDGVCDLLEEAEEREIIEALESFSHIDYGDQHRIRAESRTPGTGDWLLHHSKFQAWEQVLVSTILWLQGTKSRGKLITILANLVKDAQHPVKIFVSSRREQDIVKLLPARSTIEIDANDNRADIQKFIVEKMEEIEGKGLWESIPKELKFEIESTLRKGSDGMFRWAFLQMEQLSKCQQAKEIRDRLGKLPMSLNASYHELFTEMSSYNQETLRRAVMWVMCAYKPLSSEKLLSAVRLSMNGDEENHYIEEELKEETLRSICRHLVVPDYKRDVWKFPHASVIEYFETVHGWTMANAHCFVAKHSLICLINGYSMWKPPVFFLDEPHRTTNKERDPQHPLGYLQEYVREYWFRHVHALEGLQPHDAQLSRLVKRFMGFSSTLKHSSQQYRRWITHAQYDTSYRFAIHNPSDLFPSTNPHFGACAFGFYDILQDWWSVGVDISQVNEAGRDLPTIAAENGHEHLCEKLKGLGSDANRVLCDGSIIPLSEAITTYNADVSTSTPNEVIKTDNADMVQFLRRSHASLNLLSLASERRTPYVHQDRAIPSALLETGAHPDVHFYGVPGASFSFLEWLDGDQF